MVNQSSRRESKSEITFDTIAVNIVIHCIILFSFLSLFFYLYIANVAEKAMTKEIGKLIEEMIDSKMDKLSYEDKVKAVNSLRMMPLQSLLKRYEKKDPLKEENNTYNKLTAGIIVLGMIAVLFVMIMTYTYRCNTDIHLEHILIENAAVFTFVMAIEFLFFFFIARNYIPIKPSMITTQIVERIKTNFAQP